MTNAPTSLTHWGGFSAGIEAGDIASVTPLDGDTDPSPLLGNLPGSLRHRSRVATPAVRRGWLRDGPGPSACRGADEFVAVSWDELTELLAGELRRVVDANGNEAIYGGSYGWASAGRFHHAQSQLHRFLNTFGGYTRSVHSYSYGAAEVILPRVIGNADGLLGGHTDWQTIAQHSRLIVMFGGMPMKNVQVHSGGLGRHSVRGHLLACKRNGVQFVNVGPMRDDAPDFLESEWLAARPNTDTAIMLALAH